MSFFVVGEVGSTSSNFDAASGSSVTEGSTVPVSMANGHLAPTASSGGRARGCVEVATCCVGVASHTGVASNVMLDASVATICPGRTPAVCSLDGAGDATNNAAIVPNRWGALIAPTPAPSPPPPLPPPPAMQYRPVAVSVGSFGPTAVGATSGGDVMMHPSLLASSGGDHIQFTATSVTSNAPLPKLVNGDACQISTFPVAGYGVTSSSVLAVQHGSDVRQQEASEGAWLPVASCSVHPVGQGKHISDPFGIPGALPGAVTAGCGFHALRTSMSESPSFTHPQLGPRVFIDTTANGQPGDIGMSHLHQALWQHLQQGCFTTEDDPQQKAAMQKLLDGLVGAAAALGSSTTAGAACPTGTAGTVSVADTSMVPAGQAQMGQAFHGTTANEKLLHHHANHAIACAPMYSPESAALLGQHYHLQLVGQPGQATEITQEKTHELQRQQKGTGGYKPGGYKFNTVFVGGLRTITGEDRIISYFSKFGKVERVDIKRLPDGTSRGFCFVKFVDADSVDRVIGVRDAHTIDSKWIDVKRHDRIAAGKWMMESMTYNEKATNNHDLEACKVDSRQDLAPQIAARQEVAAAAHTAGLRVTEYLEYAQKLVEEERSRGSGDANAHSKAVSKVKAMLAAHARRRSNPY